MKGDQKQPGTGMYHGREGGKVKKRFGFDAATKSFLFTMGVYLMLLYEAEYARPPFPCTREVLSSRQANFGTSAKGKN